MNGRLPKGLKGEAQELGGILLTSHLLSTRVREIIDARMAAGFEVPQNDIAILMTVAYGGNPEKVDVEAVKGRVYQTWWDIVKELRLREVDPASGDFTIEEGKHGTTQDGTPAASFAMRWKARGPMLPVVP